ncbi:MAG: large conductance mechanosensitive channel protein MscL [Endomicrobium sp.]|jgi:large conductance mechanosensitive channel|nr:large conductance mechanosensitive channel protein MscL [Endomicrobium sp.]
MFKSFVKEFKEFAVRGNVIDMAVGIIIGAAFGKIVDSMVKDIIMPPIGLLLGKVDFMNIFIVLKSAVPGARYETLAAAQQAGAVTVNIGNFINFLISFVIVAFCVFLLVKAVNKMKKQTPPPLPNAKECPFCASSIPVKAIKCPACTADLK